MSFGGLSRGSRLIFLSFIAIFPLIAIFLTKTLNSLPEKLREHGLSGHNESKSRNSATTLQQDLVTSVVEGIEWTPPLVLPRPGPMNRFIFYHLRKCGGSTLRTQIMQSVEVLNSQKQNGTAHKILSVIPCKQGTKCDVYHLDRQNVGILKKISVVAGHFPWGIVQQDLNSHRWQPGPLKESGALKGLDVYNNLHCLTQLRDPLARTLSCIHFRFKSGSWLQNRLSRDSKENLTLLTLTPNEMDILLADGVDVYGNGCCNEGLRILSGFVDEDLINKLTFEHHMAESILDMAKRNMRKCVVTVTEVPEAKWHAIDYWHPWLSQGIPTAKNRNLKLNAQRYRREEKDFFHPSVIEVITKRNEVEIELYKYALHLVKQQEAYLHRRAQS
jgi:hypothetical protein